MSDKDTTRNETPWRARGFKKAYCGNKSFAFQEFVDANKANVLKLNLRQRDLVAGKYNTKSSDMTAANAVDLTNVPEDWKNIWTGPMKSAASVLLQKERKNDLIHAGKSADQITKDMDTVLFKSCDYQMAKLKDDMEAVYKYWLDVTGGDVREKVVRKGVTGVNDIFTEMHQDYGQAEERVVADLINLFNTGKPLGVSELDEQIDVPQYLDEMSALQTKIREKYDPAKRAGAIVLTDEAWCKAVSLAIPAIYERVLEKLKENSWMAKTLAIADADERNATFTKRDYRDEPLNRSQLREALVAEHQINCRRWKQQKCYQRSLVSMFQTGVKSQQRQGKGGFNGKCYGCGGNHKLADCPNKAKGSGNESEFRRTRNESEFRRTRKNREKATKANKGKAKRSDIPCTFWLKGDCRHGQRCDFSHELKKGSGTGGKNGVTSQSRLKQARLDKFVTRAMATMAKKRDQSSAGDDGDDGDDGDGGSNGSGDSEKEAKRMRTLLTKLAKDSNVTGLFMVHATPNGTFEAVDPDEGSNVTPLTNIGSGTNDIDGITAPNVGSGTENVGADVGVAFGNAAQEGAPRPTTGGLTVREVSKEHLQAVYESLVHVTNAKGDKFVVNPDANMEEVNNSDGGSEAKVPEVNETHRDGREGDEGDNRPAKKVKFDLQRHPILDDERSEKSPNAPGKSCKEEASEGGSSKDEDPDGGSSGGSPSKDLSGKSSNVGYGEGGSSKESASSGTKGSGKDVTNKGGSSKESANSGAKGSDKDVTIEVGSSKDARGTWDCGTWEEELATSKQDYAKEDKEDVQRINDFFEDPRAAMIGGDKELSMKVVKCQVELRAATSMVSKKNRELNEERRIHNSQLALMNSYSDLEEEEEEEPERYQAPQSHDDPWLSALTEEDKKFLNENYGENWLQDNTEGWKNYKFETRDREGQPVKFDLVLHHFIEKSSLAELEWNKKVAFNQAKFDNTKECTPDRHHWLAKWEMAEVDERYENFLKEKHKDTVAYSERSHEERGRPYERYNDPHSFYYRNKYSWSTRQHHYYGAMLRDNTHGYRGVNVTSPEYTNEYSLFKGEGCTYDLAVWKKLQETKYYDSYTYTDFYSLNNLRKEMPDDSLSMKLVEKPDYGGSYSFNRSREHEHLMDYLQHHHGSDCPEQTSKCDRRPLSGDFIGFLANWDIGSGPINDDLDCMYTRAGIEGSMLGTNTNTFYMQDLVLDQSAVTSRSEGDSTVSRRSEVTNEGGSSGTSASIRTRGCAGGGRSEWRNVTGGFENSIVGGIKHPAMKPAYESMTVNSLHTIISTAGDDKDSSDESVLEAEFDKVMADITTQIKGCKVVKALMMRQYDKIKVNLNATATTKMLKTAVTGEGFSAWDYCAGASLSDQEEDFLFIDTRQVAKESVEIVTATGSGGCEGRGPLVLFLHNSKQFGTVVLIDFDGIKTAPSENSPVRITSALRMEKMGVVMRMEEPCKEGTKFTVGKSIECLWTGFKCHLVQHDDILLIPTVKKSARNLSKNKAVIKKYIPLLKEGSTSPIVNLWEIDHRIQKAYAAQIVEQNRPSLGVVPQSYSKSPVPGWSGDPGGKKLPPPGMIPVNVLGKAYTVNPSCGWGSWPDDWQNDETLGNHSAWKDALDKEAIPMPGSLFMDKMDDSPSEIVGHTLKTKSQLPTIEECADAYMGKTAKRPLENPPPQLRSVKNRSAEMVDFSLAAASAAGAGAGKAKALSTKSGVAEMAAQTGTMGEKEESDLLLALYKGEEGPVIGELRKCTPDEYRLVESKILTTSCKGSVQEGAGSSTALSRSEGSAEMKPVVTLLSTLATTAPIDFNCVSYEYSKNEEEAMLQVLRERFLTTVTKSAERATPRFKQPIQVHIVNVSKLPAKQQARLWHWRLGHCSPQVPVKLSMKDDDGKPLADGIKVTHCLNEDCIVCAKARFKVKPFRPVPPALRPKMPPMFCVVVDGFGGQSSMGTKSIGIPTDWCSMPTVGGAVGGYSFYDPAGGSIVPLLYSKKSQFPVLLRRFLVSVIAKGFHVHMIIATDTEIVNNAAVEHICAEFDVDMRPPSVGTPEDLGHAEKSVGDLMRLARSFMLGAPHLPPSLWGAAVVWSGVINEVLPKSFNDGMTPYEFATGRIPHLRRMCIYVFGTPCEAVTRPKGERPPTKLDSLTETMSFVGTEGASKILVYLPAASRIYSVSRRKVAPQEGAYIEGNSTTLEALKKRIQIVPDLRDGEDEIMIDTVPTIRSLQTPHVDAKSGVEDGSSISNEFVLVQEPHEFVFDTTEANAADKLIQSLLKKLKEPHVKSQLSRLLRSDLSEAAIQNGQARDLPECDEVGDRSSRRKKLEEAKALRESEKAQKEEMATVKRTADEVVASATPLLTPLYRAKPGTRVKIETKKFDSEVPEGKEKYSDGKPKFTYGTVRGKGKRGVLRVLWDDESRTLDSDWRHLQRVLPTDRGATDEARTAFAKVLSTKVFVNKVGYYEDVATAFGESVMSEPLRTLAQIEYAVKAVVLKTNAKAKHPEWPRDFAEMLVFQSDWREWLGAIIKENNSWTENDAVEEVDRKDMSPGSKLIRLGELFTRKRDSRPKFRPYVLGNLLRAGVDFVRTFSGTVSATTIKWFFSLMTGLRRLVKSSDVMTGYLAGNQDVDVYVEKPSYWGYVDWPIESLADLRKLMRELLKKEGIKGVKRYLRANQNRSRVLKILRPIYGIPSAGAEFGMLVIYVMTRILNLVRSDVDPAMYYKTDGQLVCQLGPFARGIERYTVDEESVAELQKQGTDVVLPYRKDSCWTRSYIVVLTWTDDFPYAGSDQLVKWYEDNAKLHLPLTFEPVCEDFVSIEVKQDMDRMLKWLTHSKYCLAMGVKYASYLKSRRTLKHPMKPATEKFLLSHKPTDEEYNSVSNFPYREVMGTVAFPACHTKIECRGAVSILSRFMSKWSRPAIEGLLDCMGYMVYSHDLGVCFSYGLDWHGINTPYGFTDSSLNPPTSMGGNNAKMNGACIAANAKKHTLVDTSTTMAELVEAFNASQSLMGIRNMHKEMGITVNAPTTLYCDCDPAIKVVSGDRSMTDSSRALDLKVWKLRERQDVQEIDLVWCSTVLQESDLNTKSLPLGQFRFLRELLNGYALVMMHYPELKMPEAALSRSELIRTYEEYRDAEEKREAAAAERRRAAKL